MAATDLEFSQSPLGPGGPVEIVFGDDAGAPAGTGLLHIAGAITGLRGHITARTLARAHVAGAITGLRGHVPAQWDINVARPLAHTRRDAWQPAAPLRAGPQMRFEQSRAIGASLRAQWQQAALISAVVRAQWQAAEAVQRTARGQYQQARRLAAAAVRQRFEDATRIQHLRRQQYQHARTLATAPVQQRFEDAERLRRLVRQQYQRAVPLVAAIAQRFGIADHLGVVRRAQYQQAQKPLPGVTQGTQPPAPDPCYVPKLPAELVFDLAADAALPLGLLFVCERGGSLPPPAGIVVPPRRTYIVINSIEIRRADDLAGDPLPSETFQMQLDRQSWTWTFSASFHASARDAIAPGPGGQPVELEVRVNGQPFRLQAERIGRSKRFPGNMVTASGRGLAAVLDAPHAQVQTFSQTQDRTAQQLMAEVLTVNGVGFGWTVDWQITDWLVPGGIWMHQGTWISALKDIAGSVGAYLQPHDTAPILRVLPAWPEPWWRWDTLVPGVELPEGIAEVGDTEVVDLPGYDRIFVAGEAGGIQADLTRNGLPGTMLKQPMAVHPLITEIVAAKQRATAELAESGRMLKHKMTLPVLPATGVIKPGTVLRYVDDASTRRIGIVRSTAINQQFPVLTQSLEIDSHA